MKLCLRTASPDGLPKNAVIINDRLRIAIGWLNITARVIIVVIADERYKRLTLFVTPDPELFFNSSEQTLPNKYLCGQTTSDIAGDVARQHLSTKGYKDNRHQADELTTKIKP